MTSEFSLEEIKVEFIYHIDQMQLTGTQRDQLVHFLLLDDEESSLYEIMERVSSGFKANALEFTHIHFAYSDINPLKIVNKISLILHELSNKFPCISLEDRYIISLTIYFIYNQTDDTLARKLLSIYKDIKYNRRTNEDIVLDLNLLNYYNHSKLASLLILVEKEFTSFSHNSNQSGRDVFIPKLIEDGKVKELRNNSDDNFKEKIDKFLQGKEIKNLSEATDEIEGLSSIINISDTSIVEIEHLIKRLTKDIGINKVADRGIKLLCEKVMISKVPKPYSCTIKLTPDSDDK